MSKPTIAQLLERIVALEAKVKELEAAPKVVNHYHYTGHNDYLGWPNNPQWWQQPVTCGSASAIGGHSDGSARWELRQAHISGN